MLENVIVVLHRPSSAENLGAVARVLKNFGLARLSVVEPPAWSGRPRSGRPGSARADVMRRARRTARHAADLLSAAEVHRDLASALAETTWSCGTSSRRVAGREPLSPLELGSELERRSRGGPVAIVLGEERRGLSDAELELCPAVCTIPTSATYDSMNLAQAAAVLCYEASRAAAGGPRGGAPREPARHRTVEALWGRVAALLDAAGYLNPQNPRAILAEWRRLLGRAEPTQREVELLLAAARALERRLRVGS
ncbi:MAG TPA: TrmH family RNA methyltransferase [Anaeromyxobacteraceae bacterium]|nr:TrmH family RNA methyltransferase [Anaeromyxobacteraceae bacterium]